VSSSAVVGARCSRRSSTTARANPRLLDFTHNQEPPAGQGRQYGVYPTPISVISPNLVYRCCLFGRTGRDLPEEKREITAHLSRHMKSDALLLARSANQVKHEVTAFVYGQFPRDASVSVGHRVLDVNRGIPDPGSAVLRGRGNSLAVRRPRDTIDFLGMGTTTMPPHRSREVGVAMRWCQVRMWEFACWMACAKMGRDCSMVSSVAVRQRRK
jgi:hypothetical protein